MKMFFLGKLKKKNVYEIIKLPMRFFCLHSIYSQEHPLFALKNGKMQKWDSVQYRGNDLMH